MRYYSTAHIAFCSLDLEYFDSTRPKDLSNTRIIPRQLSDCVIAAYSTSTVRKRLMYAPGALYYPGVINNRGRVRIYCTLL